MEQHSASQSRPAHYKAVIPVLVWIAAGLLSLYDIIRVFHNPFTTYAVRDLIFSLFFPPMVVPAVLLSLYYTVYRRKMGGNVLLGFGLGILALSILGQIIKTLLFGIMYIVPWLFQHALFAMLLISFISVCRGRTGKLFLILSACAGILCVFSSAAAMPRSVGFVNYLRALPYSIPFWCNLFGSISLYLSLLLFGIHLPKPSRKSDTIQPPTAI